MRKIISILTVLITILSVSCKKDDIKKIDNEFQNQKMKIDGEKFKEFLEKLTDSKTKDNENGIYIDYTYDSNNETLKIEHIEEKKADLEVLIFLDRNNRENINSLGYEVDCIVDGNYVDHTECSSAWCVKDAIEKCFKQGGCAKVCQNRMVYFPQKKAFILNMN